MEIDKKHVSLEDLKVTYDDLYNRIKNADLENVEDLSAKLQELKSKIEELENKINQGNQIIIASYRDSSGRLNVKRYKYGICTATFEGSFSYPYQPGPNTFTLPTGFSSLTLISASASFGETGYVGRISISGNTITMYIYGTQSYVNVHGSVTYVTADPLPE